MPLMRFLIMGLVSLVLTSCSERQARGLAGTAYKPTGGEFWSFGGAQKSGLSLRTGEQILLTYSRVTGLPVTAAIRFNYENMVAELPAAPDPTGFSVARFSARQKLANQFCEPLTHYHFDGFISDIWKNSRERLFGADLADALVSLDRRVLASRAQREALGFQILNQVLGSVDVSDSEGLTQRAEDVEAIADFLDELLGIAPNWNAGVNMKHAAYGVCMAALTHPRLLVH